MKSIAKLGPKIIGFSVYLLLILFDKRSCQSA